MALETSTTKVGIFASSSGGGGFFTVYSQSDTIAQMTADTYWNKQYETVGHGDYIADTDERFRVVRMREALESLVRGQAALPAAVAANTGGVACTLVGTGAGATSRADRRAKLNATTGRIQITP